MAARRRTPVPTTGTTPSWQERLLASTPDQRNWTDRLLYNSLRSTTSPDLAHDPLGHRFTRHRPAGAPIIGQAVARGTVIGLEDPGSTSEANSDSVGAALDAAARQRKRAAGGAVPTAPLLGTAAARPFLAVRGLVGA